ncbi:intraflagellar transport protein 22 homolog isoform X2 [Corythoichthys intestinalis]|uniref:intraflagellar transport protein 22 homolog isoform X2 n=1 Tax=Corythoichthys intestinalis TaxID=161448 RepID=UPI0025A5C96D|nr:intraflagellar transport protein 22 homolog isoform X2 [Corythoichthys intestinalis]XP_061795645.1 intraflagellar transport protein 22 homolog isoform X2 [Nerophis lumbriciformis]
MFKAKILLIGPNESGKTVLANFLSDATENVGGEYRPTQAVRILEYESQLDGCGDVKSCEVELWDCSGDFKFESCWPALMKDCSGVVIVFNPDIPSQLKEIETWHSMFIASQSLQDSQCLLIAHHKPGSAMEEGRLSLASQLNRFTLIHSEMEEEPEDLRRAFCRYLGKVVNTLSESREQEEMSIIT